MEITRENIDNILSIRGYDKDEGMFLIGRRSSGANLYSRYLWDNAMYYVVRIKGGRPQLITREQVSDLLAYWMDGIGTKYYYNYC